MNAAPAPWPAWGAAMKGLDMNITEQDAIWVRRWKAGDVSAWGEIYLRFGQMILSFCFRTMGDYEDAADMAANTWLKAYQHLADCRDDTNVSAFLHTIARNQCLDVLRRRQRLRFVPWDEPAHDHLVLAEAQDEPEQSALMREHASLLDTVLARLDPKYRAALIMQYIDGVGCEEIGEMFGTGHGGGKSLCWRAGQVARRIASEMIA